MNVQLQMHDYRSVYLVVRSTSEGHIQSTTYQKCEMEAPSQKQSALVYDLPFDYEGLDSLNEFLHSNELSEVAKQLHNDEIDFSSDISGISGALQGTSCSDHQWWVQSDISVNCKDDPLASACVRQKNSANNVVQFGNMRLKYAMRYFLCVHVSGGSCNQREVCSNGFIIDTLPPLPGEVFTPNGQVLSDDTSVLICWDGFQDIETEVVMDNMKGIKEYFYGFGKHFFFLSFHVSVAYKQKWPSYSHKLCIGTLHMVEFN